MKELLSILENNPRASEETIAAMLNTDVGAVSAAIKQYEKNNVIMGYKTLINWENTDAEKVTAFIELKVTPQRGQGFDKIAERIYQYDKVKTLWLMSGSFDIGLIIEGKTMKDVALFVAEKLAPMEQIISTGTHFVLRVYKDSGTVFGKVTPDERGSVSL